MGKFTGPAIAATLVSLATLSAPAAAQDAGLGCMASSYSAEDRATLDVLQGSDITNGSDQGARLGALAVAAAQGCATRHGWDQAAIMQAAFFEIGRLNEQSYRVSGQLSDAQLGTIDELLAADDQSAMWSAVERSVMSSITGQNQSEPGDDVALGMFAVGAGFADSEDGLKLGILLGFMALQRIGEREFTALQEGN